MAKFFLSFFNNIGGGNGSPLFIGDISINMSTVTLSGDTSTTFFLQFYFFASPLQHSVRSPEVAPVAPLSQNGSLNNNVLPQAKDLVTPTKREVIPGANTLNQLPDQRIINRSLASPYKGDNQAPASNPAVKDLEGIVILNATTVPNPDAGSAAIGSTDTKPNAIGSTDTKPNGSTDTKPNATNPDINHIVEDSVNTREIKDSTLKPNEIVQNNNTDVLSSNKTTSATNSTGDFKIKILPAAAQQQ